MAEVMGVFRQVGAENLIGADKRQNARVEKDTVAGNGTAGGPSESDALVRGRGAQGGLASAARSLRLSPPAVTRDIAALEGRFGCKLLQRTMRQVRLTEAGHRYLSDARRILAEVAEAEASMVGCLGDVRGPIAVTAPAMFGRLHVGPAIADFEEGGDVAVRIAHLSDSSVIAVRVGAVRHILCAAPIYLDAHGKPRRLRDLEGVEAIDVLGSRLPWNFRTDGRTQSVQARTRFVANSAEMAVEAAAGCGVVRLLSY